MHCLLCVTGFSGAVGSAAVAEGGVQDHWYHLCCSPVLSTLCVPVHSTTDVQMCGIFQSPGVLGRGNFVELWVFYWL